MKKERSQMCLNLISNKNKLHLFFALGILCILGNDLSAQTQIDKVVAIVGQEIILVSDIESQYKLMESRAGGKLPENARCLVLDQLLSNALLLTEAEKDSVVVKDEEVEAQIDSRINEILKYMGGDPEQFKMYYGKTPQELKSEMKDDMRKQILIQKMQGQIMQSVAVTPKEVKLFFDRIPKDSLPYFNSEVELLELVVKPKVSPAEDQRAKDKADELRKRIIEQGADFAQIAREYSDDKGSALRGGDLGITGRGSFVPEFEAAAYQLDVNEVSEVVKSEFGYHIIQLMGRLGNNISTRHILVKPAITIDDNENAKMYLDSIRTLILIDSFTFEQAVQKFSEEDFSKTRAGVLTNPTTGEGYWELGDLEPEIYFAIEKLKIGDISSPVEFASPQGESLFKIIKIRNRSFPHIANLKDDYSRIYQAAIEEKKVNFIQEWVNKKIPKNFVDIKYNALGDYVKNFYPNNKDSVCPLLTRWNLRP